MPRPSLTRIVLLFFIAFAPSSRAWNDTGHKVVALVAWEDMTPKTRNAVTDLLKQHARYAEDLLGETGANLSADDAAKHAFAVAATWPDIVRSQNNPMHNLHHHPYWHYINIPFEDGATRPEAPLPESQGPPPHNIVEALGHCTTLVKDSARTADLKAVDLCWIEHLVGDVHQPLHAATHYSPKFPNGDAGGNGATLLRDPPYPDSQANLHSIWDSMGGNYRSEFIVRYLSQGVRSDPQFSREAMKSLLATAEYMAWANESHALAVENAYLNGQLEVALSPRRGASAAPTTGPTPGLPFGYKDKAEQVSMQRITLAGYRLADLLNSIFDPKP